MSEDVGGWLGEWVLQCMWVHVCTVHELLCVLCLSSTSVFACSIPHSIHLQTGEAKRSKSQRKGGRETVK